MGALSPLHLVLILAIALIVLGPGKLPEAGASLGKAIRNFREAADGSQDRASQPAAPAAPAAAPTTIAPAAMQPTEGLPVVDAGTQTPGGPPIS